MHAATLSPMMSDALVILGAAGIVIPVFARFRITPVIGFILVGVLVGPFGLGRMVYANEWLTYVTITDPQGLEPFAEFGIILLLFTIGLELSFNRLWAMRKLVGGLGALELSISAALLTAGLGDDGPVLDRRARARPGAGAVLDRAGAADRRHPHRGRPLGAGHAAVRGHRHRPDHLHARRACPLCGQRGMEGLFTTIWQGALVVAVMMLVGRFALPRLFAQAARTKSPELFLAASLLVVIGASLATAFVGLSPIMGALLAGLLIAETEYHSEVEGIMVPFKGLALGIFLITVGMGIDVFTIWTISARSRWRWCWC
jgi:CPA2 family monovalent cation:H+ antiporter-2